MKITEIQLKNFKFFDDLTIKGIPQTAKTILLVGPNGTGKSCIFDAFNYFSFQSKRNRVKDDHPYFRKDKSKGFSVQIFDQSGELSQPGFALSREARGASFYGRSSYRFTSKISRDTISTSVAARVLNDQDAPETYSELDQRIENDIEKALGEYIKEVQKQSGQTDRDIVQKVVGTVNESLEKIFPTSKLRLVRIVDPHSDETSGKIDLEFSKEVKSGEKSLFNFQNLSAGEKEVFDIVFNFHRRKESWIRGGVYFIDEPELHLNTKIQALLFLELHRLCVAVEAQFWIATHSLGFLRAAQDERESDPDSVSIIEFSEACGSGQVSLSPLSGTREDWKRIFQTALEDMTGLIAPNILVYCEGGDPRGGGNALKSPGTDEVVYNCIFETEFPRTLFVSNGGTADNGDEKRLEIALNVLDRGFSGTKILLLRDRDSKTEEVKENWISEKDYRRMLGRREIENYLFDKEVLEIYCKNNGKAYEKITADLSNIHDGDIKQVQGSIKNQVGYSGDIEAFKIELAKTILPNMSVYQELRDCIFRGGTVEF